LEIAAEPFLLCGGRREQFFILRHRLELAVVERCVRPDLLHTHFLEKVQVLGSANRQGLQQECVHEAENYGIRPDADC
jgi:hypothetical protein